MDFVWAPGLVGILRKASRTSSALMLALLASLDACHERQHGTQPAPLHHTWMAESSTADLKLSLGQLFLKAQLR